MGKCSIFKLFQHKNYIIEVSLHVFLFDNQTVNQSKKNYCCKSGPWSYFRGQPKKCK